MPLAARTRLATMAIMATATALVLGLGQGRAEASRRMVCEAPEAAASLDDVSTRADDAPPLPPAPLGRDVCLLGASDDPSCWPDERLPSRGGQLYFGSSTAFADVATSVLPRGPSASLFLHLAQVPPLADGHERRLERPPRAVCFSFMVSGFVSGLHARRDHTTPARPA